MLTRSHMGDAIFMRDDLLRLNAPSMGQRAITFQAGKLEGKQVAWAAQLAGVNLPLSCRPVAFCGIQLIANKRPVEAAAISVELVRSDGVPVATPCDLQN